MATPVYDLAIIGGGINGCGIARDAAGRGLSVFLCEQHDLASGTSSASTKLIHGGLRYLEHYAFRLVRESLSEREILLNAAPHIIWPLRFILPHHKGLRPAWLLRLGLFLYDYLGGRSFLPGTSTLPLANDEAGNCLKGNYRKGFEYSDCWVMDSRLVVLNAMAAAEQGARITTRSRCIAAKREAGLWTLTLENTLTKETTTLSTKGLINAAGPWLDQTLKNIEHQATSKRVRLVKGSHIVVPQIFQHPKAYIFQNKDNRIIFAIPYQEKFTLIGTTDIDFDDSPENITISQAETEYLCNAVNEYFHHSITPGDVVHSFAGVRPLFDDGTDDAKSISRDYVLQLDVQDEVPLLNIYGGKITTYRKLAESVLEKLAPWYPNMAAPWTATATLPGGDFPVDGYEQEVEKLRNAHPFLDLALARRLVRLYGTKTHEMTAKLGSPEFMGPCFGADLHAFEVRYLVEKEWACTAEDILFRRTRLALYFSDEEKKALADWLRQEM